jgi:outer membrane lipoprotein-sorting protein
MRATSLPSGLKILVGVVLALLSVGASAPPPDAHEIVRRSDQALRGKTLQGSAQMTVKTQDWERTLDMDFWSVNPDKTFIRITAPTKEAGTATLRVESNMWNYIPKVERVIKIPPSLMLQPWMGSDFSNDDLVKESSLVKDYTHTIEGEVVEGGVACYRVVALPKPDAPVVWGRLVVTIGKSDYLPRKQEFYSEKGTLQKVLTYSDIQSVDGRAYPLLWKMVSVTKAGHETLLRYRDLRFDRSLDDAIFTQRNLRQRF